MFGERLLYSFQCPARKNAELEQREGYGLPEKVKILVKAITNVLADHMRLMT